MVEGRLSVWVRLLLWLLITCWNMSWPAVLMTRSVYLPRLILDILILIWLPLTGFGYNLKLSVVLPILTLNILLYTILPVVSCALIR